MEEEKRIIIDEPKEQSLTREEVLERSRKENKRGDEMYKQNNAKAMLIGLAFSIVIFLAVCIPELIISNKVIITYACCAIIWSITGGYNLVSGILNKKKVSIITGVVGIVAAILFYATYLINLLI